MIIDVDWRQPFIDYLSEQKVPSDKNLVEQLILRAKSYVLVGDKLYKRGASSGVLVDAKFAPRAKHTASRTSWLHTRRDSKTCQSIFPEN
jgi:hypothetical protein